MEFLLDYGLFLAKIVTFVIALMIVISVIVGGSKKSKQGSEKGYLEITPLNKQFDELKEALSENSNIVHEAADTIFHFLVTLEAAEIKFEDVLKELENRKKQSGIEEKNKR